MSSRVERIADDRRLWTALVVLALLLRVVAWLERSGRATLTAMLDTQLYRAMADALVDGGFVLDRAFFMSPLYPYVLALVERPLGPGAVIVGQSVLGVAALLVLARAARELAGPVTGAATLLLGAAAPPLILYDTSLLPDGPAAACTAIAVAGVILREAWGRRALWMVGTALAVGIALRSNLLLLWLLLGLGVVWSLRIDRRLALRSALALLAPGLVVMVLLSAHNLAAEGLWQPRSYNGGLNLYVGNNPAAEGTYTNVQEVHPGDPTGQEAAQRARGRTLDSAEVEAFWRERAVEFLVSDPGRAVQLALTRAVLFVHPYSMPQMEDAALTAHESRVLAWAPFGFGVVLGLAVLGAWQPLVRMRRPRWPLVVLVLMAFAVGVVFFVNGRLRLAVWPALLVFAGSGTHQLVVAYVQRRLRPLFAPLLVVLLLRAGTLLFPVHETYRHAMSAARYASIEATHGNERLAREWLLVMDSYMNEPARFGEGRAIDASYAEKPDAEVMLRLERAVALYTVGDDRAALELLLDVLEQRPGLRRAMQVLAAVTERMQRAGSDDPRLREARALLRQQGGSGRS